MGDIELLVDPSPPAADLRLGECSSLEEFEDEVQALLRDALDDGDPVVILFHPGAGAPVTVPEAVGALVEAHRAAPKRVSVRCLFASERAKQSAERLIPGLVRPDRWASFGALQVVVVQGDIVSVDAEAIVNASNVRLELGAGVSVRSSARSLAPMRSKPRCERARPSSRARSWRPLRTGSDRFASSCTPRLRAEASTL